MGGEGNEPFAGFLAAWYQAEVGRCLIAGQRLSDAEAAARGALAALTARVGTESQFALAQVAAALLGRLEAGDDVGGRVTPLAPRGGPATPAAKPPQKRRAPAPWQLDEKTEARVPKPPEAPPAEKDVSDGK
jgi:hypothetical protein